MEAVWRLCGGYKADTLSVTSRAINIEFSASLHDWLLHLGCSVNRTTVSRHRVCRYLLRRHRPHYQRCVLFNIITFSSLIVRGLPSEVFRK